jgi:hypothetical protein
MSEKVAIIIPVHPPKKNYLIELLKNIFYMYGL